MINSKRNFTSELNALAVIVNAAFILINSSGNIAEWIFKIADYLIRYPREFLGLGDISATPLVFSIIVDGINFII